MSSQEIRRSQRVRVKVLSEDEFWSELRQFKIKQLIRWRDELASRRRRTEGLDYLTTESRERLSDIQAVEDARLAELLTDQVIDNTMRIDDIEYRFNGVVVWLAILIIAQIYLFWKLGVDLF